MQISGFDHIQIAMPAGKEDKARDFYVSVLGMTEIPKPPQLAQRGGAWFHAGDVVIHLGVEDDFRPARKAHPALLVDDLESFLAACHGGCFEIDVSQPPLEGYQRAHIFDPFGNRIELMQRIP
jgi:catechol 2,3-dioxygenase-like lactoylglutathione lyase family enzyme